MRINTPSAPALRPLRLCGSLSWVLAYDQGRLMSLAIAFVSLLSIAALLIVGSAAYVEMRPVIRNYRDERRRKRMMYADETMRVYTTVRFARARQGDNTGAIASLLLSLLLIALGVWEWGRFDYGGEWHSVEGTITAVRSETKTTTARPRTRVEYRYTVGEQTFTGYWVDTPEALLAMTGGDDFDRRIQTSAPITVWYHPLMPTYPSLSRVTLWYVVVAIGSGSFLLISSILTLIFARRSPRTAEVL